MFQITNLTGQKVDGASLKKAVKSAVGVLGKKDLAEISLVLVDDARIKAINKEYRHKNHVTDVLSFEDLSEIFICLPQAVRQAKMLKHSIDCELTRLLVHGIVHLKGYDHEKGGRQRKQMEKTEDKILKNL